MVPQAYIMVTEAQRMVPRKEAKIMAEIKELLDKINGLSEQEMQDAADIAEVLQELPPVKRGIILGYAAALAVETKKKGA